MAILGIDEVGRGPLAGPLVVGAVILPEEKPEWVEELRDSKKLTPKKREQFSEIILKEAVATGFGWVSNFELDEIGITNALKLATRRAVEKVRETHPKFSEIIIDGKVNFLAETSLGRFTTTLIKADDLIKEVSAASIIAKVARDNYMKSLSLDYPGYGFEKNSGYGTAAHLNAIKTLGLTPAHRQSFEPIKSLIGFSRPDEDDLPKNTTKIGLRGEIAVAEYLTRRGHQVIFRNFKTRTCEIDLVSIFGDRIYFTEVKTRKNGQGLEAITVKKQKQMAFATETFLHFYRLYAKKSPLLAVASVSGDYEVLDWFPLV